MTRLLGVWYALGLLLAWAVCNVAVLLFDWVCTIH